MQSINPVAVLDLAVSELTFLPSPEQRKAKSAFWARFQENPLCEPSEISLAVATRFCGDGRLSRWWGQEGFRDWFRNSDEFRQRLEYLVNLSLDSIEYVLTDPKAQSSAKVNAAKLLMEVARKMPPKGATTVYLDENISKMSKKELEEFITKKTRLLPQSIPSTDDTTSDTLDTTAK